MIVFHLPWPPPSLSPNARLHWRPKAAAAKRYRKACWGATKEQKVRLPEHDGRFLLELQFGPPDRRTRDMDNLVASCKAGLDGVADALGVDDSMFTLGAPQFGAVTKDGCVWVRITVQQ